MSIYEQSPSGRLSKDEKASLNEWKAINFPLPKKDLHGTKGKRWTLGRRIYDHVNKEEEQEGYIGHKGSSYDTVAGIYFQLLDDLMAYETLKAEEKDEVFPKEGKQILYRAQENTGRYGDFSLRFVSSWPDGGKLLFARSKTKDGVAQEHEFTLFPDGEFTRISRTQTGGVVRSSTAYASYGSDETEQRKAVQELLNLANDYIQVRNRAQ